MSKPYMTPDEWEAEYAAQREAGQTSISSAESQRRYEAYARTMDEPEKGCGMNDRSRQELLEWVVGDLVGRVSANDYSDETLERIEQAAALVRLLRAGNLRNDEQERKAC